ncbi:hypothetical protein PV04_03419 [Phialophora macrospora]|uniref:Clr5 domain-containing protein n=1 Tax=Phialophora macrospora TaxID=1851006 RepID=A0A0D2D160_9EURO|nr:hypothetical protein PV04_03419 [Phialophora macrospora]
MVKNKPGRWYPFIRQDPNVQRYSPRLSTERWEELRPQLTMSHLLGGRCVDMLKELQAMGITVTRCQLDARLKKWGLVKERKGYDPLSLLGLEIEGRTPRNLSQIQLAEQSLGTATADVVQLRRGTVSLATTPDINLRSPHSQHEANGAPEPAPTALMPMSRGDMRTELDALECVGTHTSDMTTDQQIQDPQDVSDLQIFRDLSVSSQVVEAHIATDSYDRGMTGPSLTAVPNDAREPGTPTTRMLPGLSTDTILSALSPGLDTKDASRLHHMAKLLYLMRCHDEAFEIFRHIVCQPIIDVSSTGDVGHWLLSSAIGCVRSARSSQNVQISQELILGLFGDSENGNAGHTACHVQDNSYKKTLLAWSQGSAVEMLKDTAYWTVATNLPRPAQPSSQSPNTALSQFKECSYLRRSIIESLEKMIVYLEENEEDLDREWEGGSIRDREHTIAQLLSCRLLESSFRDKCTEPSPADTDLCCRLNSPRCATIVKGQTLATLPFIVAYWHPWYELPGLPITFGPARHFWMAAKSALELISPHSHADNSGYEIFMEMYLGMLDQRDEEVQMSGNISHHRFLAVTAATAGVVTIPELHRLGVPCQRACQGQNERNTIIVLFPDPGQISNIPRVVDEL